MNPTEPSSTTTQSLATSNSKVVGAFITYSSSRKYIEQDPFGDFINLCHLPSGSTIYTNKQRYDIAVVHTIPKDQCKGSMEEIKDQLRDTVRFMVQYPSQKQAGQWTDLPTAKRRDVKHAKHEGKTESIQIDKIDHVISKKKLEGAHFATLPREVFTQAIVVTYYRARFFMSNKTEGVSKFRLAVYHEDRQSTIESAPFVTFQHKELHNRIKKQEASGIVKEQRMQSVLLGSAPKSPASKEKSNADQMSVQDAALALIMTSQSTTTTTTEQPLKECKIEVIDLEQEPETKESEPAKPAEGLFMPYYQGLYPLPGGLQKDNMMYRPFMQYQPVFIMQDPKTGLPFYTMPFPMVPTTIRCLQQDKAINNC